LISLYLSNISKLVICVARNCVSYLHHDS